MASPRYRSTSRSWSTPVWSQSTRTDQEQLVHGEVHQLRRAHELLDELETVWRARLERFEDVLKTKPLGRKANDRLQGRRGPEGPRQWSSLRSSSVHHQRMAAVGRPTFSSSGGGGHSIPATFEQHDLTPGGTITSFTSGPDGGDDFNGTWNVIKVDAPTRLVVEDAIVEDDGDCEQRQFHDSHGDRPRSSGRHNSA